jgi:hypothetical protein
MTSNASPELLEISIDKTGVSIGGARFSYGDVVHTTTEAETPRAASAGGRGGIAIAILSVVMVDVSVTDMGAATNSKAVVLTVNMSVLLPLPVFGMDARSRKVSLMSVVDIVVGRFSAIAMS